MTDAAHINLQKVHKMPQNKFFFLNFTVFWTFLMKRKELYKTTCKLRKFLIGSPLISWLNFYPNAYIALGFFSFSAKVFWRPIWDEILFSWGFMYLRCWADVESLGTLKEALNFGRKTGFIHQTFIHKTNESELKTLDDWSKPILRSCCLKNVTRYMIDSIFFISSI